MAKRTDLKKIRLFVKSWGGILQNPALFLCLELFYVYKFYVDN